jgi:hypothetical protein
MNISVRVPMSTVLATASDAPGAGTGKVQKRTMPAAIEERFAFTQSSIEQLNLKSSGQAKRELPVFSWP